MRHLKYLGVIVTLFIFLLPDHCKAQSEYVVRPLFELDQLSTGEAYAWISDDGLRIYYTAYDQSNEVYAIWHSRRLSIEEDFSYHQKLEINSYDTDNFSSWLNQDETKMVFVRRTGDGDTDTNIYMSEREDESEEFSESRKIELTGGVKGTIISPSFTQDMEQLIFFNEYKSHTYILVFKRTADYTYGFDYQMNFPNRFRAKTGKLSNDGLEYYISIEEKNRKPSLYTFSRLHISDEFNVVGKIENTAINDPDYRNHQVYFSSDKNFIVFTRSTENRWHSNSIYIAKNKNYTNQYVANQRFRSDFIDKVILFPNPSVDDVYFKNVEGHELKVLMYDVSGILVKELDALKDDTAINISDMMPGAYYFKLIDMNTGNYRVVKHIKL